ncbi:hypothetical protein L1276_005089 [Flavobacterium sp. HSC-32F16]|uniref:hypothetical protein n=1 Tax=Flavobacterium sp. HSC-32F16 TaxID=2910964 RepID=UPI0020A444BF|nr:hypothetical protein [Flavobacterium sp. HSC-32F16]MCP2029895.1 hypothetical protein [Flavobacterium sp. HSC-32F16]
METSPILLKVLQILADRYASSCSLEELTKLITPVIKSSMSITDYLASEKENQASILDALVLLHDQGFIFLNSDTDQSVITIKGLIKINHYVLYN